MKTSIYSWAALAVVAVVAGCNNNPPTGGTTTTGTTTGTTGPGPTPVVQNVDEGLKHDGYRYMGFNRVGDVTYSYSRMEGTAGQPGTEAMEVIESSPEKAVIKINRAGSLSDLGSETYEVRKDGIYLTKMALGDLKTPMLAVPFDVKVGSKWTSSLETVNADTPYKFTIENVAEKEEDVKVKAGTYKALLVSGRGQMTANGKTSTILYKTWYSKDVGTVLMRIEVNGKDKNEKSSVELLKPAGAPAEDAPAKQD